MSHPELAETADRLVVRSPMRAGTRALLAALALFPLLAPYELLVRIDWQRYLAAFFFLAVFISAGAVALSAFLVFAAVSGLSSQMVFDRRAATFTFTARAPVVRRTSRVHRLADVRGLRVGVREWSDGAPTYHLDVSMADGTVFESGSSWSRDEIESMQARVSRFLEGRACDEGAARAR